MRSKTATKADRRRFQALQELGCIACRQEGIFGEPADIHHVLYAGKRAGHQQTIPLCPWHHRGLNISALDDKTVVAMKGPSLHHDKAAFVARYGREGDLLILVDSLISRVAA